MLIFGIICFVAFGIAGILLLKNGMTGCDRYIAKSGDTNCCTTHSRKCLNCYCYIDSDAMYCMECFTDAVNKSK